MSARLEYKMWKDGDVLNVELSGSIDEGAARPTLDLSGVKQVTFRLDKVNSINSIGVRDWIDWLKLIPSQIKVVYAGCSKVFVMQMNSVAGVLRKGSVVHSVQVPFYCESCNVETYVLYTRGKEIQMGLVNHPQVKCKKCGKPAEIDVNVTRYFHFLKIEDLGS